MNSLIEIVRGFADRRLVVIGDAIADQFVYGNISRVSREAPVLYFGTNRPKQFPAALPTVR